MTPADVEARRLVNGHFGMVEKAHNGERLVEVISAALAGARQEGKQEAFRESIAALKAICVSSDSDHSWWFEDKFVEAIDRLAAPETKETP